MSQLFFEDVSADQEIPGFEKRLTLRDMVLYCAGYRDFNELHYDPSVSAARGFAGPVVPGLLSSALLTKVLTDWITPEGTVRRFKATYRRPQLAGETIICKGKVTRKRVEAGKHLVECEIWAENSEGQVATPGTALIELPSRST
jgi:acyl dehydratase